MLELGIGEIYRWILLPVLIFLARICDVSLGTIRVIFVSRGYRYLAPALGFFEISIWLLAIGQIMRDLNNVATYFAYAGGFAMGTFVGITLEDKLSIGNVMVRVILKEDASRLISRLKEASYGLTVVNASGARGPVQMVFTIVDRRILPDTIRMIKEHNPHAFYTVEDVRQVSENVYPVRKRGILERTLKIVSSFRKGK
ncbi:MAG: DUF2179 domain-containing protein [Methanomicrobiales archaeon]|nr:DUF2179 domain-containing protein [Methanomicrobiales archaeon]